jgi:hypothetical protein
MPNFQQSAALTEEQWSILLSRISKQKCTPFLGAEAVGGLMPRSEIAKRWAEEYNFPLEDSRDLAQVAQFVATTGDAAVPREKILDEFKGQPAHPQGLDEPHRIWPNYPFRFMLRQIITI